MARKNIIQAVLIGLLIVILIIAFATKAHHWEQVGWKEQTKKLLDEVYPGLEGMIAVDVLLFVAYLVGLFLTFKNNATITKVICILILILLVIRIILSIIFLAGNDEYCRKLIDFCKDYEGNNNNGIGNTWYCQSDFYKSLKGAWVMEIIAIILVNILAPMTLFMLFKGGK